MATTNVLGSSDSQLGNIELGSPIQPLLYVFESMGLPDLRAPYLWPPPALMTNDLLEATVFPEDPVAYESVPWDVPMSLPVWSAPPLLPLPAFEVIDVSYLAIQEETYADAWQPTWPVFVVPRDTYLFPSAIMDLIERAESVPAEVLAGMGVPTLPPIRLTDYGTFTLQLTTWDEEVSPAAWHREMGMPVQPVPPNPLPWTVAMGENYEDDNFGTVIAVLYKPTMWAGGW
jgi:hypothetical protein